MKKSAILPLILSLSLLLCSCRGATSAVKAGKTDTDPVTVDNSAGGNEICVKAVFKMPDYSLPENATTDEMRAMAVKAMHDELSFHWTPSENVTYLKVSEVTDKSFTYVSGKAYAGLPYTSGGSGLLQWLQYYDFETGVVTGLDGKTLDTTLGNSCATSVMWGWSTVSTTFSWYTTHCMNVAHGCVNVGSYSYDPALADLREYFTTRICSDNGEKTMFESYAAILPADALVTVTADNQHAIMAIEAAHVERSADGAIDPEKSFITLQDQRKSFTEGEDQGEAVYYRGRVSATSSFRELYTKGYIPVTAQEFAGLAPYTPATVTYSGSAENLEAFYAGSVKSPYKIAAVHFIVTDETGKDIANKKAVLGIKEVENGKVYNYSVSNLSLKAFFNRNIKNAGKYHGKLEVLVANGITFTPVEFDFVYEG